MRTHAFVGVVKNLFPSCMQNRRNWKIRRAGCIAGAPAGAYYRTPKATNQRAAERAALRRSAECNSLHLYIYCARVLYIFLALRVCEREREYITLSSSCFVLASERCTCIMIQLCMPRQAIHFAYSLAPRRDLETATATHRENTFVSSAEFCSIHV